jgi:hypothetical protein
MEGMGIPFKQIYNWKQTLSGAVLSSSFGFLAAVFWKNC